MLFLSLFSWNFTLRVPQSHRTTQQHGGLKLIESKIFGLRNQGSLKATECGTKSSEHRATLIQLAGSLPNRACAEHKRRRVAKAWRTRLRDKPPFTFQTNPSGSDMGPTPSTVETVKRNIHCIPVGLKLGSCPGEI